MNNPIKDNRIVNDITFATRLNQFLDHLPSDYLISQPYIVEEYSYLKTVAVDLLKYQITTIETVEELNYFKNLSND